MSSIKTFEKGETIIRGCDHDIRNKTASELLRERMEGSEFYGMIIVSGSVVLEKEVTIREEQLPCGENVFSVPPKLDTDLVINRITHKVRSSIGRLRPRMKTMYLSVATFAEGDFFCPIVKESDYVYGVRENTTILYVPRTPFLLHKTGDKMIKLFNDLSQSKISVNYLLRKYNMSHVWKDYKHQLIQQVLTNKQKKKELLKWHWQF